MSDKDKISVIIPCYNVEKYLRECLDSVISQSCEAPNGDCFDMEIICVDDCSTDDTRAILQEYEQRYPELIMVILLADNCGLGAVRNIAINYASGNYIIYLDSDDILIENAINVLYKAIKTSNSDFVRGSYMEYYPGKTDISHIAKLEVSENTVQICDMEDEDVRANYIITYGTNTSAWAKIYKKDFLLQNSLEFMERTFMEDICFSELCMLYAKRIGLIDEPVYLYRIREGQIMQRTNTKEYYLATALVQNDATVRAMNENLIRSSKAEFAFLHYMQAFYFPLERMKRYPECYSYTDYIAIRDTLLAFFPDFMNNKYLRYFQARNEEVYGGLLKKAVTEEELKSALYGSELKVVDILVAVARKGGVENVIKTVLDKLEGENFHFRVVQLVWEGDAWLPESVEFHPLGTGRDHVLKDFVRLYQEFVRRNGAPDIILATAWPLMSYVARAGIVDEKKPVKVISWLHTCVKYYEAAGYGGMDWLENADCHFAISEEIRQELLTAHPEWNVVRVYNPAGSIRLETDTREGESKGLKHRLLFVGRLSEEKNIPYLLNTLAHAKKWSLQLVGDAETKEYERELKKLSNSLGVNDRVEWLGWQDNPWKYAAGSDAFVMSSIYEGFALAAIEAMSCGLPVLSSDVEGCRELIVKGENGYLYDLQDETALASLLTEIERKGYVISDNERCRESAKPYETDRAMKDFGEKLRGC